MAQADLDQDGDLDLVVGGLQGGIKVLSGYGDGTFELLGSYATDMRVLSVALGDLDGDGIEDAVLASGSELRRILGVGDGTFVSPWTFHTVDTPFSPLSGATALQDLNDDGVLDVATESGIFLGEGGADYFAPAELDTRGSYVARGDFNGDGWADLAYSEWLPVNDPTPASTIAIVLNEGVGTAEPSRIWLDCGGGQIDAGDLNGDGKSDLVVVGPECLNTLIAE